MQEKLSSSNEKDFEIQSDEMLKEIEAQQFITPKEKLGYDEEYITIKFNDPDKNTMLNYSLSNSLEDIKMAIFRRTGYEARLENANWVLNRRLSIYVKHLMNKYHVLYSMTTYDTKSGSVIGINMRVGDNWFFTSYAELEGKFYPWDYYDTLEKVKRVLKNIEDKFKSDSDIDDDE